MEILEYFKSFNPVNTKLQDFIDFQNDSPVVKEILQSIEGHMTADSKIILKAAKGTPILPDIPFEELYITLFASNIVGLGIGYREIKNTSIIVETNSRTINKIKNLDVPFQINLLQTTTEGPIKIKYLVNNNLKDEELKLVFIYITDSESIKGSERFEDIYDNLVK